MEKTIVALATPAGNSGVAVIRVSGERAKEILQKIIREDLDFEPRKMYLKKVYFSGLEDISLVVFFHHPHSYTGEDVIEIQSHGGYFVAEKIIDELISLGCTLATPGEFSKRAFINGKLSLDQAEGIMDLINAESEMQAKNGSALMQGELKKTILDYQNRLTDILAEIEAKLDYPEYEYTENETSDILYKLKDIETNLSSLIADSKTGIKIKNGVSVALIGAPNVGKSSLLNALTKSNKSIVTSIAGTTRDVIEGEYEYNGIIFRLYDTAGIHESEDEVEKIGIERAKQILREADIVLKISDDSNMCNISTDQTYINVFNKSDIIDQEKMKNQIQDDSIFVSAKKNENIDSLKQLIFDKTISTKINSNKLYLTNTRHITAVKQAKKYINNAISEFNFTSMDIISSEIKSAWISLGEVTGDTNNETIIDKIFSKFCLGK